MKKLIAIIFIFIATTAFAETYTIEKVIDVDTLKLANGDEVQLIGLKAPEDERMGQKATEFARTVLKSGQEVIMEFDVQEKDQYGRLLAYVFTVRYELQKPRIISKPETFINALIIKSGYASPMITPPNVKYAQMFENLYQKALAEKRGLWAVTKENIDVDYQALAESCKQRGSVNCCMSSLRTMRENNYFPASEDDSGNYSCPEGFNRNLIRCIDSFIWCQPVEQKRNE